MIVMGEAANRIAARSVRLRDVLQMAGCLADVEPVVAEYGLTFSRILGKERLSHIVRLRQWLMMLIRDTLHWSYPAIGDLFDRDHTTVIVSIQRARTRKDPVLWEPRNLPKRPASSTDPYDRAMSLIGEERMLLVSFVQHYADQLFSEKRSDAGQAVEQLAGMIRRYEYLRPRAIGSDDAKTSEGESTGCGRSSATEGSAIADE